MTLEALWSLAWVCERSTANIAQRRNLRYNQDEMLANINTGVDHEWALSMQAITGMNDLTTTHA
jgi:hypothetical protein